MNKKGFVRIVEASIAILLVLGVIMVISVRKTQMDEEDFSPRISSILEEIGNNATLRKEIITNPLNAEVNIDSFVNSKIRQKQLAHRVKICDINSVCALPENIKNTEIFVVERVISASLDSESFSPKKIRIFLWRNYNN